MIDGDGDCQSPLLSKTSCLIYRHKLLNKGQDTTDFFNRIFEIDPPTSSASIHSIESFNRTFAPETPSNIYNRY